MRLGAYAYAYYHAHVSYSIVKAKTNPSRSHSASQFTRFLEEAQRSNCYDTPNDLGFSVAFEKEKCVLVWSMILFSQPTGLVHIEKHT